MLAFCVLLPLHAPVRRDVDLVDDLLGQASGFGVVPLLLFHHLLLRCLHASEKRRGKAHTITPPHHIVELEAKLETERLEIVLGLAFQVLSACTRWITCAETPTPQWHARQRRGKHENEKKNCAPLLLTVLPAEALKEQVALNVHFGHRKNTHTLRLGKKTGLISTGNKCIKQWAHLKTKFEFDFIFL
jgi:hypothetical protein